MLSSVSLIAESNSVYYRFKDSVGKESIGNFIPPKSIKYGYEVIDSESNVVIETIAPQMSKEEIELYLIKQEEQRLIDEKIKEQERVKNELFSTYRTLEDVDIAEKNKLESVDINISQLKRDINLTYEKIKLEEKIGRANEYQGKDNAQIDNKIKQYHETIKNIEKVIDSFQTQKDDIRKKYAVDRMKMKEILNSRK